MVNKTVAVIVAHPDDEVLGCEGTISKHKSQNDQVYVVFVSDGVTSRVDSSDNDLKARIKSANSAKEILGVNEIFFLNYPDNKLDTVPFLNIVQSLEEILNRIKPDVVYTHHYGDLNIDHRLTNRAVATCRRPMPGNSVFEFFGFEILSSTDWSIVKESSFIPNTYVDISKTLQQKIQALNCYSQELRAAPHSRSVENVIALAKSRGYTVGLDSAEAFISYRMIR